MPNNLDMGGFGSPGLPVRAGLSGSVTVLPGPASTSGLTVDIDPGVAAAAKSLDIKTGGVTRASVSKTGALTLDATGALVNLSATDVLNMGGTVAFRNYVGFLLAISGTNRHWWNGAQYTVGSDGIISWSSTNVIGGSADVLLLRHAAGALIQRNGTNAQQSILSRSWISNADYSWYRAAWNTTTLLLMAEGAGSFSDGSVAFNDAALATNATVGFVMIPSCAGTPTGVPADIPTGQIPMVWDSTNLKLYAYTGGAWKASAAFT